LSGLFSKEKIRERRKAARERLSNPPFKRATQTDIPRSSIPPVTTMEKVIPNDDHLNEDSSTDSEKSEESKQDM
jgi:hypothetical protein